MVDLAYILGGSRRGFSVCITLLPALLLLLPGVLADVKYNYTFNSNIDGIKQFSFYGDATAVKAFNASTSSLTVDSNGIQDKRLCWGNTSFLMSVGDVWKVSVFDVYDTTDHAVGFLPALCNDSTISDITNGAKCRYYPEYTSDGCTAAGSGDWASSFGCLASTAGHQYEMEIKRVSLTNYSFYSKDITASTVYNHSNFVNGAKWLAWCSYSDGNNGDRWRVDVRYMQLANQTIIPPILRYPRFTAISPANNTLSNLSCVTFSWSTNITTTCKFRLDGNANGTGLLANLTYTTGSYCDLDYNHTIPFNINCSGGNGSVFSGNYYFKWLYRLNTSSTQLKVNYCPDTLAGVGITGVLSLIALVLVIVGFAYSVALIGVFGSLLLLPLSWTLAGCNQLYGYLLALCALTLFILFAVFIPGRRGNIWH